MGGEEPSGQMIINFSIITLESKTQFQMFLPDKNKFLSGTISYIPFK